MKYLLVFLAFFVSNVLAMKPEALITGTVKHVAPCGEAVCVFAEKDGKPYIAVGLIHEDGFYIYEIYEVIDGKPMKVWDARWRAS